MKPAKRKAPAVAGHEPAFREIIGLIAAARRRAFQAVNTELIELYWRVVEYIVASWNPPRGAKAWWMNWRDTSPGSSRTSRVSPVPACFGCGNFMTLTAAIKSRTTGATIAVDAQSADSWRVAKCRRNGSFICDWRCGKNGAART